MIEIDANEIIVYTHYIPYEDSKEELLKALYKLIVPIHKEIYCIDFELFIDEEASITSCGRWKNKTAYTMHRHMQYMEEFYQKSVPLLCKAYHTHTMAKILPPITALSLLKES